jgi:hypothetical protein
MFHGAKKLEGTPNIPAKQPPKQQETVNTNPPGNFILPFETNLAPKDKVSVGNLRVPMSITSLSFADPSSDDSHQVQDLKRIGTKYKVPFQAGEDLGAYQVKVVKAVVIAKAKEHGVPEKVALGMAGLESEMKMWENIEGKNPVVIQGKNFVWKKDKKHPEQRAKKMLSSTDWGVMQVNDKAHPGAFPKAKTDLEENVDFGMKYLAETRQSVKGSLKLGFGDWDRTIGAYNLGHNPSSKRDHKIARRYILAVKGAIS